MTFLVTGAAGFLGACVAERAAQAGHDVIAVSRGPLPSSLTILKKITHLECDLVTGEMPVGDLAVIIHCAASIPSRENDDSKLYADNVAMGKTILRALSMSPDAVLVNMSSMSVYGPVDGGVVDESTPVNPQDSYGRAKLAVERLIDDSVANDPARKAVSLRLPGMVGARSHANFMSNMADALLRGESARVFNPNGLFNNIVYGYDLAEFLADSLSAIPAGHEPLTIAASDIITVREAATHAAAAAGVPADRLDFQTGDRQPFTIGFARIRSLGYRPASVLTSVERFVRDKRRQANAR